MNERSYFKAKKSKQEADIVMKENEEPNILGNSDVQVGDLIRVGTNQRVPADLLLVKTTKNAGASFIRIDQLDGETDTSNPDVITITTTTARESNKSIADSQQNDETDTVRPIKKFKATGKANKSMLKETGKYLSNETKSTTESPVNLVDPSIYVGKYHEEVPGFRHFVVTKMKQAIDFGHPASFSIAVLWYFVDLLIRYVHPLLQTALMKELTFFELRTVCAEIGANRQNDQGIYAWIVTKTPKKSTDGDSTKTRKRDKAYLYIGKTLSKDCLHGRMGNHKKCLGNVDIFSPQTPFYYILRRKCLAHWKSRSALEASTYLLAPFQYSGATDPDEILMLEGFFIFITSSLHYDHKRGLNTSFYLPNPTMHLYFRDVIKRSFIQAGMEPNISYEIDPEEMVEKFDKCPACDDLLYISATATQQRSHDVRYYHCARYSCRQRWRRQIDKATNEPKTELVSMEETWDKEKNYGSCCDSDCKGFLWLSITREQYLKCSQCDKFWKKNGRAHAIK